MTTPTISSNRQQPDVLMVMLSGIAARLDRMERTLEGMDMLLCGLHQMVLEMQQPPPPHGVPAPTEAQFHGELLARAIREVSR